MTEDQILKLRRHKRPICHYSVMKKWSVVPWECRNHSSTVYKNLPYCLTHARILKKQEEI